MSKHLFSEIKLELERAMDADCDVLNSSKKIYAL